MNRGFASISRNSMALNGVINGLNGSLWKNSFHTSAISLRTKLAKQKHRAAVKASKAARIRNRAERVLIYADPILGRPTSFTMSLLRPSDTEQPIIGPKAVNNENKVVASEPNKDTDVAFEKDVLSRIFDVSNQPRRELLRLNIAEARRQFQRKEGDTGSPEVQAAIFTARIHFLVGHYQQHPKDYSNRRELLRILFARARILRYLKREDANRYVECLSRLGIDNGSISADAINSYKL